MKIRVDRSRLESVTRFLSEIDGMVERVGWFEDARYEWGATPPVAMIAQIHEYGAPAANIPARPFMRPTIEQGGEMWKAMFAQLVGEAVKKGATPPKQIMQAIGEKARADVRVTIMRKGSYPVDSAVIYRRRHRKTPPPTMGTAVLRDTFTMVETLDARTAKRGE
jgi:hypothetical protein